MSAADRREAPRWRRLLWTATKFASAATVAVAAYTWLTLPAVGSLASEAPATTAFMRLRADQAEAAEQSYRVRQQWIDYDRISPALVRAVLVSEDAAFWSHNGVDYDEVWASVQRNWEEKTFVRGASTITQQLAKNLYLSPSRNPYRKVRELLITRRLEATLSKQRILELYLNLIEWGDGIWGVEAAARAYFGVSAADLTAEQAALLAAAIPNPRVYNPAAPSEGLRRRQQLILSRM